MESITNYKTFEDDKKSLDDKISLLERYILADDKESFFNTLVFNSDTYLYMKLNDMINKGEEISTLLKDELSGYFDNVENSLKLEILFKDLSNRIGNQADPAKRKQMIERFNLEFLSLGFDFNKPVNVKKSEGISSVNDVKFKSSLNAQDFNQWSLASKLESYDKFPTNTYFNFGMFKPNCHLFMDLDRMLEKNQQHFEAVLKGLPHYFNFPNIEKTVANYFNKCFEKNKAFALPPIVFTRMSLTSLKKLETLISRVANDRNYIASVYVKQFQGYNSEESPLKDRLSQLKEIYAWCSSIPVEHNGLSQEVLKEILTLSLKNKVYEEEYFIKFLEKPPNVLAFFSENHKVALKGYVNYRGSWLTVHNFKTNLWNYSDIEIIQLFLENAFKSRPYEEWKQYFNEKYLKDTYYKFKLIQGEKFSNITDFLTEIELNTLRDKRELKITGDNKMVFLKDEEVKINLRVKNIQSIQVNIFEINSFNYYKKKMSPIDAKINLTGMIPTRSFSKELKYPPLLVREELIAFEDLTKVERGVFIIEFVGDGLSSRALIKKGCLNLVRDSGNEGHHFYILDEENSVLKGKGAKLYLKDKIYEGDEEGKIFVPFLNEVIKGQVIFGYDNYHELCQLDIVNTDIVLDASIVFNEESLESGNNASFIIQPKLFAYNRPVLLNKLKNTKIVITSSNSQNVKHSKVLEGEIKFEEGQDFVVDYLIPSKTNNIEISIKSTIIDQSTQKEIKLSLTKTIKIERKEGIDVYYDLFLKQENEFYKLVMAGKNGETYPGCQINLVMNTDWLTTSESVTMETNEKGEVDLGELRGVWNLAASVKTAPGEFKDIHKVWNISKNAERFNNFPEEFDFLENEDLCIPALGETLTRNDYSLYRTDENYDYIFDDCFGNIQKEGELLYLSKLKKGSYVFYYNQSKDFKKITLRVHQGKRWEVSNDYLITNKKIMRLLNQANYLTYTDVKIKDHEFSMKVLSNELDTLKVHLLAFNFFPDHIQDVAVSLKGNTIKEKSEVINLARNFNEYYGEKEISDELKYVMERKNRSTFMGNTLEKPSGLLKRHFNKKTQADRETLSTEKGYSSILTNKTDQTSARVLTTTRPERNGTKNLFSLKLVNSFLADRGSLITNASVDPDGIVTVDISKFSNMNTLCVIIEDKHNNLCQIVSLPKSEKMEKRDQRLTVSREANKVYLHERTTHNLKAGQALNIKDINNTEISIVDNLAYQMEILKLISGIREIDEWDFLKRWDSIEAEEALKKYDKYISHEFHLFAYFKDPEFFDLVIKAHIQNKNEKTFVDFFLLDNKAEMKKYLDPVNIKKLNIIEKCLLIMGLKDVERENCMRLFSLLKLQLEKIPADTKLFNSVFDSVLKSEQAKEAHLLDTEKDARNTIGTNMTNSRNLTSMRIPSQQRANYDQCDDFLGDCDDESMIKENRGGSQSFRTMGVTEEFTERQYYYKDSKSLGVTQFWLDFISHQLEGSQSPFLSEKFILSARTNTEMLMILSISSLPFERVDNQVVNNEKGFNITVGANSILFCKEIKEKNNEKMDLDMTISQQFFDIYDRTERARDGSNKLKKITDFVTGKLYASRIAITNFSETQHEVTLISEIPQGSIPVRSQDYLKSTAMPLEPLSTKINEFLFYFPHEGEFTCYPAAITKDGCLIASSTIQKTLMVYKELPTKELKTMKDILSVGKTEDILNFMKTQNITDQSIFNFGDIYWLLKDKVFYESVISILEDRFIFDEVTYSFSVFHEDVKRMKTYLSQRFAGKRITCRDLDIYYLKNELFEINDFKFKEYFPLVNPRVHDIGEYKHNILNRDFMNTYITFLKYLLDKAVPSSRDYLYLAIYFLLQDRVDDVLQVYSKINRSHLVGTEMLIQYDYLDAYLDLYLDYPKFTKSREICTQYLTYPIYTWRNKFIDLANQIAEFDGEVEIEKIHTEDTLKKNKTAAEKQVFFEASIDEGKLKVQTKNVTDYIVNYYKVDLEVMFSQDPFIEMGSDSFSFIKPNLRLEKKLAASEDFVKELTEIPVELAKDNLLIQLICKDIVKSVTYFPSTIQTYVIENYGQVKVSESAGKPLSKVYVKCFAKDSNGTVRFYKDGYTDMRGTFDYASLNLESQRNISMFALLISSKQNGSIIQKVNPPCDMIKSEGEAMTLKAEGWQKKQMEQVYTEECDDVFMKEEAKEGKMKKNKYWK